MSAPASKPNRRTLIIIWIAFALVATLSYTPHLIYLGQRWNLLPRPSIPGVEIVMKDGWLPMSFPGWLSFASRENQPSSVAYCYLRWYRPGCRDFMIFWQAIPPRNLENHITYKPRQYAWGTAYVTPSIGNSRPLTDDWGYIPEFNLAVVLRDASLLENVTSIASLPPHSRRLALKTAK